MSCNLVKKTHYNTKDKAIENKLNNHNHDKCIDTPEFNILAADVFNARLAQANLMTKMEFDAKLSSLNRKITQNKIKHLLVEIELCKLKTFDWDYFLVKFILKKMEQQNYFTFQPLNKYFEVITNTAYISSW